jgi:hypothetical protein
MTISKDQDGLFSKNKNKKTGIFNFWRTKMKLLQ